MLVVSVAWTEVGRYDSFWAEKHRLPSVVTNQELQRVGCTIAKVGEKCDETFDVGGTWVERGKERLNVGDKDCLMRGVTS